MSNVSIHPPKTPVTEGSNGIAKATLPNVCKMPGPPAPFVPTPLPNIAKSSSSPKGYSTSVTIEGHAVAIRGATFESMGDMASKGTGGGLISASTHGPAKFITPGSMTVKIEGKNVHLLGEPMFNNCGPSGSPPNTGATMTGLKQKGGEKPKENSDTCQDGGPHHIKKEEHSWDDMLKKQEALVEQSAENLEKARQARADAQQALEDRTVRKIIKGKTHTSQLRRAVDLAEADIAEKADKLDEHQKKLRSLEFEKKVADECGGGKNYKLRCEKCSYDAGDLDVVTTDGRVKEVKSSEVGFTKKKKEYERYKRYVEDMKIVGDGMRMKLAVPPEAVESVERNHPELKGLVQGHSRP